MDDVMPPTNQTPEQEQPSVETPPTTQAHVSVHKRSMVKPMLLVLLVLILMGGSAYGAYKWERARAIKVENSQQSQITSLQQHLQAAQTKTPKKTKKSTSTSGTTLQSTYTSKVGGYTISYPTTWTITGYSGTNNTTKIPAAQLTG